MLFILVLLFPFFGYSQYPLLPQSVQHDIVGVVGELRGGGSRYHYGLDFSAADGTNVYAINTGPLRKLNGAVAIGEFGYIHVTPTSTINALPNGTVVTSGTVLGQIYTPDLGDHVHLQKANVDIYGSAATSWETGGIWINPINNLAPFSDSESPVIDWVRLYRQGTNNNITSQLTLFGQIDVYLNSEDDGIDANGSPNTKYNLAPLTADFDIDDDSGTTIYAAVGIDFSNVPPNASANTIFHNTATSGNWIASLTNDPFNTPYNKYWNSRKTLTGNYNNTADTPENTENEGKKIKFKISSCDRFTCTSQVIPSSPTDFYTIDNFLPFITSFHLYSDVGTLFEYNRTQDENGNTLDNGLLTNEFATFDNSNSAFLIFPTVFVSEPMKEMFVRYSYDDGITWTAWEEMSEDATNPLLWQTTLTGYEDGCTLFNFKGKDKANNDIINVYEMTQQNTIGENMFIPTRSGNTTWNNTPAHTGEDLFYTCTECATQIVGAIGGIIISRETGDCDDISDFEETVVVDCEGNVIVGLDGLNTEKYIVGWLGTDNLYHLGEETHIGTIGDNCYIVESLDGCCNYTGCIEVTGEETHLNTNYIIEFHNSYDLMHKRVDVEAFGSGIKYPVKVSFFDENEEWACAPNLLNHPNYYTASCSELLVGQKYCIEFEDNEGCISTYCFTVEGSPCTNNYFDIVGEITDADCSGEGGKINIDITPSSTICSGYSIEWDDENSSTTANIAELSSGTYCVTVTYDAPCENCFTVKCFDVNESSEPLTVDAITRSYCAEVYSDDDDNSYTIEWYGFVDMKITGGDGNYSFSWDPQTTGQSQIDNDYRFKFNDQGPYCVTITDGCGNTFEDCFEDEPEEEEESEDGFPVAHEVQACLSKYGPNEPNGSNGDGFYNDFKHTNPKFNLGDVVLSVLSHEYPASYEYDDNITFNLTALNTDTVIYNIFVDDQFVMGSLGMPFIPIIPIVNPNNNVVETNLEKGFLELAAFPNPFSNELSIIIESKEKLDGVLEIYSMMGQKVYSESISIDTKKYKKRLGDLDGLRFGVYNVIFRTNIGSENIRVVKVE